MSPYTLEYTTGVDAVRRAAGASFVQPVFDVLTGRPQALGVPMHDGTRVYHANAGVTVKYVVLEERRLVLVFSLTV